MAIEFKLPDIGEGIAEGEIVKWLVKVGDTVKEHQSVVEVMTDKATVEVPAPAAGRISEIRAKEGETVPVGKVIFVLDSAAAPAKPAPAPAAPPPAAPAAPRAPAPAAPATGTTGTIIDFKLPDVGEGIAEGEIVKWLVQVGDAGKEHHPVVEGSTDKATVEIPPPAPGRFTRLLPEEGEAVPPADGS